MNPIYDRVGQILAELGDTAEAYAQIAAEAQAAGLSAGDLAAAISTPEVPISEAAVLQIAEESGQPFTSSNDTSVLGGIGDLVNNINIDDTGSSVTIGGSTPGVTVDTSGGSTPVVNDGPTLGGGITDIDLSTDSGSGVTIGGGTGVTVDTSGGSTPETVPGLSSLTPDQLAFAQTLPVGLQDDYIAAVNAGLGDETSGATLPSLAELLRDRGLTFEEAAQAVGLTPDMENYSDAVRAFYNVQPLAPPPLDVSTLTPEQIALIESQYGLQPIPVQPTVDLSSLNPDQLAFAQTLPVGLQDDYIAAVGAGLGDETSGATTLSLTNLLKDRGLTFSEAATATGLTPENENYASAVRAFYDLNPELTSDGLEYQNYENFPGGVYGPGQAMPNIPDAVTGMFVPQAYTPFTQAAPGGPQPAGNGTPATTLFSPGISTYAQQPTSGVTYSYPQPFGDIDIFNRTNPTGLTAYTPPPPTNTNS